MASNRPNPHAVPLRAAPDQPDALDPKRVALVGSRWSAQDAACQGRDRMVEEHVRMLAGRQWDVWSDVQGQFVDPLVYLEPDERRWRQRPVIDYLSRGYQLALAKLTESPPVISFLPATSDREDAMLAETADTIVKTVAQQADMDALRATYMGWAWTAGHAYLKSRVVYDGEEQPIVGPAVLPGPEGQEIVAPRVPYDAQGNPLAKLVGAMGGVEGRESDVSGAVSAIPEGAEAVGSDVPPDMDGALVDAYGDVPSDYGYGDFGYEATGEAATRRKARIVVDVLTPVEVRTEWRVCPIQEKRWIIHRTYLTRGEIEERYGIALDPNALTTSKGADGAAADKGGANGSSVRGGGYLERLKLAAGHFGAVSQKMTADNTSGVSGAAEAGDGLLAVDEMWEKPCPEYTDGRLLVVLPALSRVLLDGPRPFQTVGAGPFREIACLRKPGRMFPSTPLEMAVPLQKALNRTAAHIMEHTARCANPKLIVDAASGIDPADLTNKPGQILEANLANGTAMMYVAPAALGTDVYRMRDWLREELVATLNIAGSEGTTPTADASGELVEQLRYNADRAIASHRARGGARGSRVGGGRAGDPAHDLDGRGDHCRGGRGRDCPYGDRAPRPVRAGARQRDPGHGVDAAGVARRAADARAAGLPARRVRDAGVARGEPAVPGADALPAQQPLGAARGRGPRHGAAQPRPARAGRAGAGDQAVPPVRVRGAPERGARVHCGAGVHGL
jgi:hypothetical protein